MMETKFLNVSMISLGVVRNSNNGTYADVCIVYNRYFQNRVVSNVLLILYCLPYQIKTMMNEVSINLRAEWWIGELKHAIGVQSFPGHLALRDIIIGLVSLMNEIVSRLPKVKNQ